MYAGRNDRLNHPHPGPLWASSFAVRPVEPALPFYVDTWVHDPHHSTKLQFLTHAHKDHTQMIDRHARHVVCTRLTQRLVLLKYPQLQQQAVSWYVIPDQQLGSPLRACSEGVDFFVTALPTDHCPGACMYLMHGGGFGTILHTGDARLIASETAAVQQVLYDLGLEQIDLLYLDCQMANSLQEFPTPAESLQQLADLISTSGASRVLLASEKLADEMTINYLYNKLGAACYIVQPGETEFQFCSSAGEVRQYRLVNGQFAGAPQHRERCKELQLLVREGVLPNNALTSDPNSRIHVIGAKLNTPNYWQLAELCKSGDMLIVKANLQYLRGEEDSMASLSTNGDLVLKAKPQGPRLTGWGCIHYILHCMHSPAGELQHFLQQIQPNVVIAHSAYLDAALFEHVVQPMKQQRQHLAEILRWAVQVRQAAVAAGRQAETWVDLHREVLMSASIPEMRSASLCRSGSSMSAGLHSGPGLGLGLSLPCNDACMVPSTPTLVMPSSATASEDSVCSQALEGSPGSMISGTCSDASISINVRLGDMLVEHACLGMPGMRPVGMSKGEGIKDVSVTQAQCSEDVSVIDKDLLSMGAGSAKQDQGSISADSVLQLVRMPELGAAKALHAGMSTRQYMQLTWQAGPLYNNGFTGAVSQAQRAVWYAGVMDQGSCGVKGG